MKKANPKKIKTWIEDAEGIRSELQRIEKRLDKLRVRAEAVKAASVPMPHASESIRHEAQRACESVENAAATAVFTAKRLITAITSKSDRELASAALEDAKRVCMADYFSDVRNVAEEFIQKWRDGEFSDRDEAIQWIDESVDGSSRVMYTHEAIECIRFSDNDSAGPDEMGAEIAVKDGSINWSGMAYFAFRADIMDRIGAEDDIGVNDEPPQKIDDHPFFVNNDGSDSCCAADPDDDASEVCGSRRRFTRSRPPPPGPI